MATQSVIIAKIFAITFAFVFSLWTAFSDGLLNQLPLSSQEFPLVHARHSTTLMFYLLLYAIMPNLLSVSTPFLRESRTL
jgi:hypothetical protein